MQSAFIVQSRDVDEEALQTDVQRCEKEWVWREDPETVLGPNKRVEFLPSNLTEMVLASPVHRPPIVFM